MVPEIAAKSKKYLEKWMPKSTQKCYFSKGAKSQTKIDPMCDFEPKKGDPVALECSVFGNQGPQRAAPSTRTRHKKEGERQKERRSKKERKGTR